jgi:PAS domain S-box-containing protein
MDLELEIFRTAIFDTIRDPLLVLDKTLVVISVNEAFQEYFTTSAYQLIGQNIFEILNKCFDSPKLRELMENVLPENKSFENFEVSIEIPSKGKRHFSISARLVHTPAFKPTDMLLLDLIDVTDRKTWTDSILILNDELRASNYDLENLGHIISHDLRAPIRAIDGFTKIILSEHNADLKDEVKEWLNRIVYNAEVMEQMISGLMELSRISRSTISKIPFNLSDLVKKITDELKKEEPQRVIEFKIQQDIIEYVEPTLMLIAFLNIFRNAWKFTRDKVPAKIQFGFNYENGKRIFFVKDNGIGFNMKYIDRLFGMFQRLHTKSEYEGTGAGLAIAKRVIERHNGKIWAYGEEGKGATIYFTLND